MKTLIFLTAICVSLFTTYGVSADSMILDYKDVQFFKVQETERGSSIMLELSGLAFHSSLTVESIETQDEDGCIIVLVHLTLARSGLTGNCDDTCDVPENVNCVYFGTSKQLIWKRSSGIEQ
jgi:hypothetical protein